MIFLKICVISAVILYSSSCCHTITKHPSPASLSTRKRKHLNWRFKSNFHIHIYIACVVSICRIYQVLLLSLSCSACCTRRLDFIIG
ncbi:hypothetical protein BDZ97DRAFT_1181891 [Flammula alnicola]|nr:hypothetical protein BDZ97DRAFT_1181891 [Flammula alnicola]